MCRELGSNIRCIKRVFLMFAISVPYYRQWKIWESNANSSLSYILIEQWFCIIGIMYMEAPSIVFGIDKCTNDSFGLWQASSYKLWFGLIMENKLILNKYKRHSNLQNWILELNIKLIQNWELHFHLDMWYRIQGSLIFGNFLLYIELTLWDFLSESISKTLLNLERKQESRPAMAWNPKL